MNAGDVKVRLIADLSRFSTNLTKATGLIRGFASTGIKSVGMLTRSLKSLTGLPALGVGAMFGASVHQLAKFQEQMGFVSTMLDEQSMKLIPRYEKSVKSLAVQFGESTSTISRGLYQTLSASVAPTKAIKFLTTAMKAAQAGMTDTETAADILTTMLNSYGYAAEHAGLMSDRLFGIVKRGKTTFSELASAMGNVASGASLVGMNVETVGAALATMTRSGLSTAEAVTALNRLIQDFNKPRGKSMDAAKKFGIELKASTLAGNGLLDVLKKLRKAMDEGTATSEDIAALASRESGYKALAIMVQNLTGVQYDYNSLINSAGSTQEQYEKTTSTLMHRLKQFWQLLLDISRSAVEPFSEDMKKLIDYTLRHREAIIAWVTGVTKNLRSVLVFLGTEWQTGWTTSGKAIEAIMKATVDAISIILEDGMMSIGRNLPKWLWKGISVGNLASKNLWQKLGQKIGMSISMAAGKALSIIPGGAGERMLEQVRENQAKMNAAQEEGAGTAKKLDAVYNELAETLRELTAEQRRVRESTGVRGAENAWRRLTEDAKLFVATFKGAGWTPGMQQLIDDAKKASAALKDVSGQYREAFGKSDQFPEGKKSPTKAKPERSEEDVKIVEDYVARLQEEVDVMRLVIGGYKDEAQWQEIVNGFKAKGIKLTEEEIQKIQRLEEARASAQGDKTVQEHIGRLQDEVDVLRLAAAGYEAEAKEQKIVNSFKQQGIQLTQTQIDLIRRLEEARDRSEAAERVDQYVDRLQGEVDVLKKLVAGHKTEAESLKIVNSFKMQGIVLTDEQIKKIEELLAKQKELNDELENNKETPTKWQAMWEDAASGIDSAMEDAFVSITKNVKTATDAIDNMLAAMQEAVTRSMFQQYMQPGINQFVGRLVGAPSFGQTVGQSPDVNAAPKTSGFARGGLVYARNGMFTPKGSDTVPAMLTPGEGVLDKDLTARLRKTLQVAEPSPVADRPITINVSAIDAAGTYQFLQKNQRAIASMIGNTNQKNHPNRRG